MLKYRIFFLAYGGCIYDAYKNDVISEDEYFDTLEEAAISLVLMNGLRKDLVFVILPVVVFSKEKENE